jgi:hypothetical protein
MEKITLDMLNEYNVSVKTDKYVNLNGEDILVSTHRKTYDNSINGRMKVQEELPELYKSVVMMMWGEEPLLSDDITL